MAVDGDATTAWTTDGDVVLERASVWFDLGSEESIGSVQWLLSEVTPGEQLSIEVSTDRREWQQVAFVDAPIAGEWQIVNPNVVGRFVRFSFINTTGEPVFGYLAEVRITP